MASGRIILPITEPLLSNTGLPVSGATLTIHIAGGSTLASIFADAGLTTPVTNPQTSDSAGRFYNQSTVLWADASQAYDCTVVWGDGTTETYSNIYLLGAALDTSTFAPIASPLFTGNPRGPTPALNDNSISLATTAFVKGQNYAPLASPGFSGIPTGPTAASGTNSTQLATTAFVQAALGTISAGTGKLVIGTTLIQWGVGTVTSSSGSVVFPTAYANTSYTVLLTPINTGAGGLIANANTLATTGFSINGSQSGSGSPVSFSCPWAAFGQSS